MLKHFLSAIVAVCLGATMASAATVATTTTYAGANTSVGNCIPFGCPDLYGPNMGFVYRDTGPFTLNIGDIVAFDTGAVNDTALSFDLSIGQTRGNSTQLDGGMTFISSLAPLSYGDRTVGNYDIAFVVAQAYSYSGSGNLVLNLRNTNGRTLDLSANQNLVYSSSPNGVLRYYLGNSAGDMRNNDRFAVANLQITTFAEEVSPVPLPATAWLMLLALGGMALLRRRGADRPSAPAFA